MARKTIIVFLAMVSCVTADRRPSTLNVVADCPGVVADGATPLSAVLQKCADACTASSDCAALYFPAGAYLLDGAPGLAFDPIARAPSSVTGVGIVGDGRGTVLLWAGAGDLIRWTAPVNRATIDSFQVQAAATAKPPNATALRFARGVTQSIVRDVLITSSPDNRFMPASGVDLGVGYVTDTVEVIRPLFQNIQGTGISVGHGSEVRIEGGRVFGSRSEAANGTSVWTPGSIGLHVTGNNGGVHVMGTDLIGLEQGLVLDNSSGAGSNREIFLVQATLDSNWRGLVVRDNSYVDFSGVWTASSGDANIWVSPASGGALLSLTGGTIFNAGTYAKGAPKPGAANGLVVHAGSLALSGVTVRNNKGVGLWTKAPLDAFTVSGCKFYGNGKNLELQGDGYAVTGNVFAAGASPSTIAPGAKTAVVANNVGLDTGGSVEAEYSASLDDVNQF